ncbi:MAG TPA: GNAT family N-acetyltransferase [Candidatus Nanopelagicales bacterium]|nr:GNAT family N-acetyltransferase [Candidatus Nanopelagicales bacterium]
MTAPPDGVVLRTARTDELTACADVWRAGLDGYGPQVGRPPMIAAPGPLVTLLAHLRATDPDRFLVAVRPEAGGTERVVAFASASRREHVWFLGMLFVHPDEQARGLGRALLEAILPTGGAPVTLATCTDAAQPISNALYARYGMVPRVPVLELVGRPDRAGPAALPEGVRAVPFELLAAGPADGPGPRRLAAALETLDRATLGYAHPQDHAFLAETGRLGHLYEAGDGRIVGYGYVSPVGRVGPLAVEDTALLPGVLGHLLQAVQPAGAFSAWVPGAGGAAVTALLDAGLRLEDFPALLCWDRPFADFSRYIPITLAIL